MPMLIPDSFDRKLVLPDSNHEEARAFLEGQPTPYEVPGYVVPHGYRLLVSRDEKDAEGTLRRICLIADGDQPSIAYKLKLLVRESPTPYMQAGNATQVLVWRSMEPQHSPALYGFARMMFAHLLESHNIMITDEEQTDSGKRFWMARIGEALGGVHHVSYIDLADLDDDLVPVVHPIKDITELYEVYEPKGWGAGVEYKNRAFVISKSPL